MASGPELNLGDLVVRNNAFVGFGLPFGVIYLDEGTTPITNVLKLNTTSQPPACGRGGNFAIDDPADAGFVSLDPNSPGFLVPMEGSPLIDAGLDLPLTCEGVTIEAPATDILGQSVPCGDGFDIGAHEWCP